METNKVKILMPISTGIQGNLIVESPVRVYAHCEFVNVSIGAFSHISSYAWLLGANIGRYCSIGDYVHIVTQQPTKMLTTCPLIYSNIFDELSQVNTKAEYAMVEKTTIGNDVWIGSGVKIKTGLTIGDGAVIGANSVVTKNVAPYSVVAGTPAKHIKMRFPPKIVSRLKRLSWWKYNLTDYDLKWDDIEVSLQQLEKLESDKKLLPYVFPTYRIWKEVDEIKAQII